MQAIANARRDPIFQAIEAMTALAELFERRREEMEARRPPRNHTERREPGMDGRERRLPQPTKHNGHRQR